MGSPTQLKKTKMNTQKEFKGSSMPVSILRRLFSSGCITDKMMIARKMRTGCDHRKIEKLKRDLKEIKGFFVEFFMVFKSRFYKILANFAATASMKDCSGLIVIYRIPMRSICAN